MPPRAVIDPDRARNERHARHPVPRGTKTAEQREHIIKTTLELMDDLPPAKIAEKLDTRPETIKSVIKAARESLQSRAQRYVDAHLTAAEIAAMEGDAGPAQWALEHISEGEQRIVEKDKGTSQPALNIGINIGGLPLSAKPIDHAALPPVQTSELPVLEAVAIADTP